MPTASVQRLLLTVLQISDVHFGSTLRGDDRDGLSARYPALLAKFEHLEGLLGHHYKALSALTDFVRNLRKEPKAPLFIMTGDLTASGSPNQYNLATDFFCKPSTGSPLGVGLGNTDWSKWAVSGNHDQWPGNGTPIGKPSNSLTQHFSESFPIIRDPMLLANGASIRFIFIDTDKDVGPYSLDRLLARGCFVSQLEALDRMLPEPEPAEFRVLVMHHAATMPGGPLDEQSNIFPTGVADRFQKLTITQKSLRVLQRVLVEHNVRVVLSGHQHVPKLSILLASDDRQRMDVLEARCGTTTQLDRYPYPTLKQIGENRKLPPNSLILHRVFQREQTTVWDARIYWRARNNRFVSSHDHVSSLLPAMLNQSLVVMSNAADPQ